MPLQAKLILKIVLLLLLSDWLAEGSEMELLHVPVLLEPILEMAKPVNPKRILDCTFGRGGHAMALLRAYPESTLLGLDQDQQAIDYGSTEFRQEISAQRLELLKFNFHHLDTLNRPRFDLILADLGVSSPQLDQAERGFSFYNSGPLDMRMDQTAALTAAEIVNSWTEVELMDLFLKYGEVHRPQRAVKKILEVRKAKPFSTTTDLSEAIVQADGWQRKGHHPATRYFLALRMAVNDELAGLEASVPKLLAKLAPGGRLMFITFHSLEDRIIKYALKEAVDHGRPVNKKVIVPTREEEVSNPRARSAKLRVFAANGISE